MYNGYSNWETWNCVLWLTNDEYTYSHYMSLAAELKRADLADLIEEELVNGVPDGLDCGLYSDLLSHEIQEIDFDEVADAFLDK